MQVMFQVTIISNIYNNTYANVVIDPPNRAGGKATQRGTDANSGDGWVGKLIGGGSFPELVQKVPAQSAFEPRVRRPMRAPPYRP